MKYFVVCLSILGIMTHTSLCANAASYTITDLGRMSATSMNAAGQVGGIDGLYPALWSNGSIEQLASLNQHGSVLAINDSGQAAGYVGFNDGANAAVWSSTGSLTILPELATTMYSEVMDINNEGVSVGHCQMWTGNLGLLTHACYWKGGQVFELTLPAGNQSLARSINNRGDILLESSIYDHRLYIYSDGVFTTLLTDVTGITDCTGTKITDDGTVLGDATMSDGSAIAYAWKDGVTTVLPILQGYDRAGVRAANSSGLMVGNASRDRVSRAVVWEGQQVRDLNQLISQSSGWTLEYARDINDAGQIVGTGTLDGVQHSYMLTPIPVPEPGSLLALASGVAGLGAGMMLRKRTR